jgi:hypothetical protein
MFYERRMRHQSALTKLQVTLIIDVIVLAAAFGGYMYLQSLPSPLLDQSKIQLTDLRVDQEEVLTGQNVKVSVNVTNIGTETGSYVGNLTVDGVSGQPQSVELASAQTKVLEFVITNPSEGVHSVKIGNLEVTFRVLGIFRISDLAINRTEAKVGEPIGISAKVTNRIQERKDYSVTLAINNTATETKTGSLDGGAATNILFEVVEQVEGTYVFNIGSLNGTFKIGPSAPPPRPAEFNVTNLVIDPTVAEPNAPVKVSVNVTNIGELSGSLQLEIKINNVVKETKSIELAGGQSSTVEFTIAQAAKGTYAIAVGNLTGELSVQDASLITLTNMFVKPYEVWVGEAVTVTVAVKNPGADLSSKSLKLMVDGEVVETKTATVAGGFSSNVEFTVIAKTEGSHKVAVNELSYGGFKVVKTGFHTLSVSSSPVMGVDVTVNGAPHKTFYSELLPVGTYNVAVPATDPTGQFTFQSWDTGASTPSITVNLQSQITVTASFTGGSSCPSLYMWNGTSYVYVSEVSNHGWLGYINYLNEDGSIVFYRNHPWDYIPLDSSQLQLTDGNFNLTLIQRWNEIFYLDQAYMVVVDHPADVNVYSTMVEQYLDTNYVGKIYTVSKNPLSPVSAVNEKGQNVLPQISTVDRVFTPGITGLQSPSWDNITWNRITLDLGDLSGASQIKLLVKAIVNWGDPNDYATWLDGFFAQPVPNGTQITPPPYMEVKDANGNWVRVPQSRDFPLPPDGVARTYVVDLTGLFPTDDYSLRISNFWNVTFDYIGVDTTTQQNVTIQRIDPQAYLYQSFGAGTESATGNFTRYGNVTQLVLTEDDKFVIGKQGDAVSLQFSTANLAAPAEGMVRDYFLFEATWFKDTNGNWGFGFGFTVDPLPFRGMSGFPYPPDESYPFDPEHQDYLSEWNTRVVNPP